MTLPYVKQTIKDGGLGIVPVSSDNVVACVGVCSSGTANAVYAFSDQTTGRIYRVAPKGHKSAKPRKTL